MQTWRERNPGADRRVWAEPHQDRGRKLVWLVGTPLLVAMLGFAGLAASDRHFHVTLPFVNDAHVVSVDKPRIPAATTAPAPTAADEADSSGSSRKSNSRRSH
jgi:hypothetical protein